jgi:hypothetical protein
MKDKWPLIPMTLGLLGPFLVFMSACGYPALAIAGKITWVAGALGSIGGRDRRLCCASSPDWF